MRVTIYKLKFSSGFHLGAHGIGTESTRVTIPADTLFSALLTAWARLGEDPESWATAFPRRRNGTAEPADPPFLLTSAFPYAGGVLLFPKPAGLTLPNVKDEEQKDWKKVKFVSERIFFRVVSGKDLDGIWPVSTDKKRCLKQGGAILVLPDEADTMPDSIWNEEKVPRVALDRVTSSSNLYSVGRVSFAKDSGLWFGVQWRDPDRPCGDVTFSKAFDRAFAELHITGLGGDRSAGQGKFVTRREDGDTKQENLTPEPMDTVSWPDPEPGKPAILLSRYHPRADELPDVLRNARAYSLESVGGWGASPAGQFRRRTVALLEEGSTIVPMGNLVMGDLIDVSPSFLELGHPVWRYGLAFLVPAGGGA